MKPLKLPSLLILLFLLVACSPDSEVQPYPPVRQLSTSVVPMSTLSPTIIKVSTSTGSLTPSSEPSQTPTTTPSPTVQPTSTPTAIPWSEAVLRIDNIDRVTQLQVWGRGVIHDMASLDDGSKLAVQTPFGVYLYNQADYSLLAYYQDGESFLVSPSTDLLAVAYPAGLVELRDGDTLDLLHRFEHQAETPKYPPPGFDLNDLLRIRSLAFSPDETTLAVGYGDNKVKLYRVEDGIQQHLLHLLYAPSPDALRFTPDGKYLLSEGLVGGRTYQNKLGIWSMESGDLISIINNAGRLSDFPFHPDSTRLVTSKFGGFILIYSLPEGELVFNFGTGEYFPVVEYSADGEYFLIDGGAQVRGVQDGKLVPGLDSASLQPDRKAPVELPEDQKWALGHVGGLERIRLEGDTFDLWGISGRLVFRWDIPLQEFSSVELDPAVRYISSLSVSPQGDWAVLCADTRSSYRSLFKVFQTSGEFSELGRCLGNIVLSPDGQFILKNNRYFADILDSNTGELVKNIRDHTIKAFTTDGSYLLTERSDEKAYVWKSDLSRRYLLAENPPNVGGLMAVSPDGTTAVIEWDKLRFWRLSDGWQVKFLPVNAASMTFSPNGAILAVGDSSGIIHLIEVPTWKEFSLLDGHRATVVDLVFTPDGKNLLSASSDGTLRLWGIQP